MGIKADQLRELIIRPTLKLIGLWDPSAENLLMGTAAQESHLGSYIKQINGPAVGIFQMEPATYSDILVNVVGRARAADKLKQDKEYYQVETFLNAYSFPTDCDEMIWDIQLATIMCRLQYWRFDEALPKYNDIRAMAEYWKKYYNTINGKGKVQDFIHNYKLTGC